MIKYLNQKKFILNSEGHSLIEVIIALAIFAMIFFSIVSLSVGSFNGLYQGGEQTIAEGLAQQGIEAVRSVRDRAWNELVFENVIISTTSNQWVLNNGTSELINDKFTRTVKIEEVCRDALCEITECPGLYVDIHSKKITVNVSWSVRNGATNSVQRIAIFTNWESRDWTQTDWSVGNGQVIFSDASRFESDDGNLNIGSAGQVSLKSQSNNCGQKSWSFESDSGYNFNSEKIDFVDGVSELYGTSTFASDKPTVSPVISYSVSEIGSWLSFEEVAIKNGGQIYYQLSDDDGLTWQYWDGSAWGVASTGDYNTAADINTNLPLFSTSSKKILFKAFLSGNGMQQVKLDEVKIGCEQFQNWDFGQATDYAFDDSRVEVLSGMVQLKTLMATSTGSTLNPSFNSNTTNWNFNIWETSSGATVAGARVSSGGNPNGYVNIRLVGKKNKTSSGYWSQAFTTTESNPTIGLVNFNWKTTAFSSSALTLYKLYVFVDSAAGAPTIGTEVWSTTVTGVTSWASISNINIASKLTAPGTYYLKFAAEAIHGNSGNPATITTGFDNVQLNWASTVAGGFSTTSPTINPVLSFTDSNVSAWTSFQEIATKNGGSINYQLSDDDGSAWQYFNGSGWVSAGANNFNSASELNANVSTFSTSSKKIMVKAFLQSNGNQLVQLDNLKIGRSQNLSNSDYVSAGSLVSSAFDMSKISAVQVLEWDEFVPTCSPVCQIKMQIRTAPDAGGSPGTWSAWYGSGGEGTYFTDHFGDLISTDLNGNKWVQYRAELLGDSVDTPILQAVRFNYK